MKIDLKQTTKLLNSVDVPHDLGNHNVIEVVKKQGLFENIEIVMWGGHEKEKGEEDV